MPNVPRVPGGELTTACPSMSSDADGDATDLPDLPLVPGLLSTAGNKSKGCAITPPPSHNGKKNTEWGVRVQDGKFVSVLSFVHYFIHYDRSNIVICYCRGLISFFLVFQYILA